MSIKSKVFAAAAALTLIGGLGAVDTFTAGTAGAATPTCADKCLNIFSLNFGTYPDPNFVLDVLRQGENVGQPIVLFRTASTDPAEDFTVSVQGYVSTFYQAGLVSSALELHYAGDFAFELEYSPYGVDSGLCMGTAVTAFYGSDVSLQPCGKTAKTIWLLDLADAAGAEQAIEAFGARPEDRKQGINVAVQVTAPGAGPRGRLVDSPAAARTAGGGVTATVPAHV